MAKNLLALFFLTIVIFLFFNRIVNAENLNFATGFGSSDLLDFNYPERLNLAKELNKNNFFLWSEYSANGFPIAAQAETGVFSPINIILFKLFNPTLAFNLSLILPYLSLSMGTYFFCRSINIIPSASLLASATIPFTGFFMSHLQNIQIIQSASFTPWAFLLAQKLTTDRKIKYALLLAFPFSLSILSGHLPTAYSVILFTAIFFILRYYFKKNQSDKSKKQLFYYLSLFLISVVLTITLSAIQILPTLEMIPYSTRQLNYTGSSESEYYNLGFEHVFSIFNPFHAGDPSSNTFKLNDTVHFWEYSAYIGIIPLVLSLGGFFIKKGKIFVILLFVSLFIVLGFPNFLFAIVWNLIPGLNLTRFASRYLLFTNFFLIILAALTVETIIKKLSDYYEPQIRYFRYWLLGLFLVFVFIDLWGYFYFFYNTVPKKSWLTTPNTAEFLKKDKSDFHITTIGKFHYHQLTLNNSQGWRGKLDDFVTERELLGPSINTLFGIKSIHFPNEYSGSFTLQDRTELSSLTSGEGIYSNYAPKVLGIQNVKYIISWGDLLEPKLENPKTIFKKVFSTPGVNNIPIIVYENPEFIDRAYLVQESIILSKKDLLQFLISEKFNPKNQVVLEKEALLPKDPVLKGRNQIKKLESSQRRLKFEVYSTSSAYFVLTDTFYPGWEAKVNGSVTEILNANYAFRALPLRSGTSIIELEYNPKSFFLGKWITLSSFFVVILYLFISGLAKNGLKITYKNRDTRL